MEQLKLKFPCRSEQIDFLDALIGQEKILPSSFFIYGMPAVGKTSVVLEYLKVIKVKYAYINCIECYSYRLLFESILSQLLGSSSESKCDSMMDLITELKKAFKEGIMFNQPVIIVLDGIEQLQIANDGNTLAVFAKLQEFTCTFSLSVIFISKLLPEKFDLEESYIPIHFPQYTKEDFTKILRGCRPCFYDEQFYDNYLHSALYVFLRTTRDFNEMKSLVLSNFQAYCEPVVKGEIDPKDLAGLWRHVVPHLRASLNSVYLGCGSEVTNTQGSEVKTTKVNNCPFDLPYYTKYFLISAYLASYNSPKHDKRLFVKNHGNKKKRDVKIKEEKNVTNQLLGPKPFSVDRLLAIFYAILEEKASHTVNLMSQIASLVKLGLLARMGDASLENPKYKCLVGLECVESVAKTLEFNLKNYLLD